MKKTPRNDRFKFIKERTIREEKFELTRFQSGDLRRKLPKNIYWCQLASGSLVMWNWTLLQSYLLNGDCPQHQALVDEFLATIPTAA
jgi:hypothetical protein